MKGAHIVPAPTNPELHIQPEIKWRLLCSAQRALLQFVTPNLRCVYVNYLNSHMWSLDLYFDRPPDENDEEQASMVDTEMISDFAEIIPGFNIFTKPAPESIQGPGWCVYGRYEPAGTNIPPREAIEEQTSLQEQSFCFVPCLLQRILLGRITVNMREIAFLKRDPTTLELIFYFEHTPSDLDVSLVEEICADLSKAFPAPKFSIKQRSIVVPYPQIARWLEEGTGYLYSRYEAYYDE